MKRVAYARELAAAGHKPAAVARVLQISRQAIYRVPKRTPAQTRRAQPLVDDVERAIVESPPPTTTVTRCDRLPKAPD